MTWVLIIWMVYGGSAVHSAEFDDEQACHDAGQLFVTQTPAHSNNKGYLCLPKAGVIGND